jgi:NADP-dependent 3-hydroxy acid dehydrogenase YdfG
MIVEQNFASIAGFVFYNCRTLHLAPTKVLTPMLIKANLNEHENIQTTDFAQVALWVYQQSQTICIRDLVVAPTYYPA